MVTIIKNDSIAADVDISELEKNISRVLDLLDVGNSELAIALETDNTLLYLNKKYLGIESVTDVLSFQSGIKNPETGNDFLGDIVISLERTISQAEDKKHSINTELLTLIIHGLLHLLGYDHADKNGSKIMFDKQEKLLSILLGV
ncbi:MAG: rRNA maturation RNase YbeY [Caldisericaceae bacterium]|nr:rRNA maturation RNase YbeY [Caldisericaceae bacterium]